MTIPKTDSILYSKWLAISFIILLASLHFIKPELAPSWNFISEYQVGKYGWLMQVAFIFLGSSCLLLGVGLWESLNLVGKIGAILLCIAAIGMLMGGVFKTDALNTSAEAQTTSGHLHQMGAMLDQIPFAAILITIALYRKHDWKKERLTLVLALIFVWFSFVYFVTSVQIYFPTDGKFGPNVPVGWQNRLMIISQAAWVFFIANQAYRKKIQPAISGSV